MRLDVGTVSRALRREWKLEQMWSWEEVLEWVGRLLADDDSRLEAVAGGEEELSDSEAMMSEEEVEGGRAHGDGDAGSEIGGRASAVVRALLELGEVEEVGGERTLSSDSKR